MIRWLWRWLGWDVERRTAPLVERLQRLEREGVDPSAMERSERALQQHAQREAVVDIAQAIVDDATAKCQTERRKTQSELQQGSELLDRALKRRTAAIDRRRNPHPNPFLASELVRKDAERRRREA